MNIFLYKRPNYLLKTNFNQTINVINRFLTKETDKESNKIKKVYNSEDRPPIPLYKGFQGDDYTRATERINKIKSSFKYGSGPRMQSVFIKGPPVIRMQLINRCANRPFYRIVLIHNNYDPADPFIEDLGSFDPLPNKDNSYYIALNLERIKYHLGRGVLLKGAVQELLGLAGFLPVHPQSYLEAFRNRKKVEQLEKQLKEQEKKTEQESSNSSQEEKTS